MGQTKKRHYDRYTLEFKIQAVKLANHPNVKAKDIAESLSLHLTFPQTSQTASAGSVVYFGRGIITSLIRF